VKTLLHHFHDGSINARLSDSRPGARIDIYLISLSRGSTGGSLAVLVGRCPHVRGRSRWGVRSLAGVETRGSAGGCRPAGAQRHGGSAWRALVELLSSGLPGSMLVVGE